MKHHFVTVIAILFIASGCAAYKNFTPRTRYAPQQLQKDYEIFQTLLEQEHPGLYWYAPKDSIDLYFKEGKEKLKDSLTEIGFRNVLSYVVAKINCGHTSVKPSRQFYKLPDSLRNRPFPLSLKIWPDTAVITANINRKDSVVTRGAILTSIDGVSMNKIVDSLFRYLPADGYNLTHKYQTLSNRGAFSSLYTSVFGYRGRYNVTFIDTLGNSKSAVITLFPAVKDTSVKKKIHQPPPQPRLTKHELRKQELTFTRNLRVDSVDGVAFMDLNSFTKDARLPRFFKRSFKKLAKDGTDKLVIDLRGNGGGSVTNSNLLTKYIVQKRFKIADTLYTLRRHSNYSKYQKGRLVNWLFITAMTRKKSDGHYHFRYFENKHFKPKKKYHYNGQVYVLTGGNTFSASTLFLQTIKGQSNVTVVGEETGGGAYGNNAWLIPDVVLPNTKVRFRLPLFRLVIDKNAEKGSGVKPDVPALPTVNAIRNNADFKVEKVYEIIRQAHQ